MEIQELLTATSKGIISIATLTTIAADRRALPWSIPSGLTKTAGFH